MARAIPYCERCNYYHASDEPCFGFMDKDDCETELDEKLRKRDEAADRARENELDRDQN